MSELEWHFLLHAGFPLTPLDEHQENGIQKNLERIALDAKSSLSQATSAIDVVVAAIAALEDDPLFSAGYDASAAADGDGELDAALVDGHTGEFGAVGCVTKTKNPIRTAKALLESGPPFLFGSEGDAATQRHGLRIMGNDNFLSPKHSEPQDRDHGFTGGSNVITAGSVGAIAVDNHGRLAIGTSRGRATGRASGRVGGTTMFGAGLYADSSLGILCAGDDDTILRSLFAKKVADNHRRGMSLDEASQNALNHVMRIREGNYGVVVLDSDGCLSVKSTATTFFTAFASSRTDMNLRPFDAQSLVDCTGNHYMPSVPATDQKATDATNSRNLSDTRQIYPPRSWTTPSQHVEKALSDPWYNAIIEMQNILYHATVQFFKSLNYKYALVPATTNSISSPMDLGSDSEPVLISLFGEDTYLVDSMQFALEYLLRLKCAETGMYYIGSVSRGEDPDSMHLNQFIHIECELFGVLSDAISVAEKYVFSLIAALLKEASQSINAIAGTLQHLKTFMAAFHARNDTFPRITLAEALKLPNLKQESYWKYIVESDQSKGVYLTREGEHALIRHFGGPVWIVEPYHLSVAFYQAYADRSREKARCADLLLGCGETLGLGERHATASELFEALRLHGVNTNEYEWYIRLKEQYPASTSGFGMGLERLLLWILQHDDIRDVPIIPRLKGFTYFP